MSVCSIINYVEVASHKALITIDYDGGLIGVCLTPYFFVYYVKSHLTGLMASSRHCRWIATIQEFKTSVMELFTYKVRWKVFDKNWHTLNNTVFKLCKCLVPKHLCTCIFGTAMQQVTINAKVEVSSGTFVEYFNGSFDLIILILTAKRVWPYPNDCTLPDGKHKKNPRVVVTIITANADNETMQHG